MLAQNKCRVSYSHLQVNTYVLITYIHICISSICTDSCSVLHIVCLNCYPLSHDQPKNGFDAVSLRTIPKLFVQGQHRAVVNDIISMVFVYHEV